MLDDGSYYMSEIDPITEVMGPEHGGRTRMYSKLVGSKKVLGSVDGGRKEYMLEEGTQGSDMTRVEIEELRAEVKMLRSDLARLQAAQGSGVGGSSCASGGSHNDYEDIEETTQCDMLWPFTEDDTRVARGLVYPTRDRILHGHHMASGFVKVQVDTVDEDYKKMFVPLETRTDEVVRLEDAISTFIQWPRKSIKPDIQTLPHESISPMHLQNPSLLHHPINDIPTSSCYRPEMEEYQPRIPQFQHQTDQTDDDFFSMLQEKMAPYPPPRNNQQKSIPPLSNDEKRIAHRLDILACRAQRIINLAKQFEHVYRNSVRVVSPTGMYSKPCDVIIEYEALLDWCVNNWIDHTLIHWCSMHYFMLAETNGRNKCAFFNIECTLGELCLKDPAFVKNHILEIFHLHNDKSIFAAPYLQKRTLFHDYCLSKHEERIYIGFYQTRKNKNMYYLTSIMEQAFGNPFKWTMVNCFQQEKTWECGHILMRNIFELVMIYQHNFPKQMWNDTRFFKQNDIDEFLFSLVPQFVNTIVKR